MAIIFIYIESFYFDIYIKYDIMVFSVKAIYKKAKVKIYG